MPDPTPRPAHDLVTDFAKKRDTERRRSFARRPKRIKDILARLITERGYGRIEADQQLQEAWHAAVGLPLAHQSRPGKIRRGQLEILVSNSTIRQEFTFQKQRILKSLRQQMPEARIRDLRFRVGPME